MSNLFLIQFNIRFLKKNSSHTTCPEVTRFKEVYFTVFRHGTKHHTDLKCCVASPSKSENKLTLLTNFKLIIIISHLLYLSVSTWSVIGQFHRQYSTVWPAKFKAVFVATMFSDVSPSVFALK